MKNKIKFILLLALYGCILPLQAQHSKPFVIPELKEWQGDEGYVKINKDSRIIYTERHEELRDIARILAEDIRLLLGWELTVTTGKARPGDIELCLGKRAIKHSEEEYGVTIGEKVRVIAPKAVGVYWATRTLLQLLEQDKENRLPRGKIFDWPDYAVRGFMLDCGRKYIPLEFLRDYVRIMSYYKMNTFQIHLNDNAFSRYYENNPLKTYAAFRLECESFPGLTAEDGFYTKQEFIDLQKLAEEKFVNIIPEIDVPAHSLAFTRYRPSLGSKEYGMDHLDLFNPGTYEFLDSLFAEYLGGESPVFRGKQVHIGTDEYSNKDLEVVEKFRYFTDYYIRYVEKFGKQACIWGALTHAKGKTPVKSENVIMNAWYNGYADPSEMITQGYKLISIPDRYLYIVPAAGYYYDYLNTEFLYDKWTPAHVGEAVFEERHSAILGGMFAVWNDHTGNGISTKDIHDRALPAMQVLAVKMWTGASPTFPFPEFERQRGKVSEAPGVNQAGRIGSGEGLVYELKEVIPGKRFPHLEAGYDYRVEFELEGQPEVPGTVLFRSPTAVFYLSDPIRGMMGFSRDGYLNVFPYRVKNERVKVRIEGDNKGTRLYVNDKLIEDMNVERRFFNSGKDSMNYVRTLVFPLSESGDFKSKIRNLQVYQK